MVHQSLVRQSLAHQPQPTLSKAEAKNPAEKFLNVASLKRQDVVLALYNIRTRKKGKKALRRWESDDLARARAFWTTSGLGKKLGDDGDFPDIFLKRLDIPIRWTEDGEEIEITEFDSEHGEGAARKAIAQLRTQLDSPEVFAIRQAHVETIAAIGLPVTTISGLMLVAESYEVVAACVYTVPALICGSWLLMLQFAFLIGRSR